MEIPLENIVFSSIYGVAAIQSLLLAIVLWWRKAKKVLPNRLLAALNLLFAFLLLVNTYELLRLAAYWPFFNALKDRRSDVPFFAGMIPSFDESFEQFAADLKKAAEQ